MRFGILQRYVMGEVFRAFALALLTITCVFVLLTVMTRAASAGLGPLEILKLVPYMIPSSLPYTVPVSLLFASTVVYGRLASDNEVIAVKTAGLSAMILIWPSVVLALVLSLGLSRLSATEIPRTTNAAKKVIYQNIEDYFYKMLKKDRVFNNGKWPFFIQVSDVQDRVLIKPTFKKRSEKPEAILALNRPADAEDPVAWDMVIQASEATIDFDFTSRKVTVYFKDANISKTGLDKSEATLRETSIDLDIPGDGEFQNNHVMIDEMTVGEMRASEADFHEKIALERKRQAVAAAWYIGSGRLSLVKWGEVQSAFSKQDYWIGQINKYETEIQMRLAMAWGSLFFVVLGAPVGILFARRDFLSAFISCFMPIIVVYYPMMLLGVNLGKEGIISPYWAWAGNLVLWAAAWFWALPPVRKH